MSATRNYSFSTMLKSYVDSAASVLKTVATFTPIDHFLKGASQFFRGASFLTQAKQTREIVGEVFKINILYMAGPLVVYSLFRENIEKQSTEYQLMGVMAFDLALTVFIKLPVWITHTIDNTAYSLGLSRAVANDVAYLLPHTMAKQLGEKLSPIFVEIFLKDKNKKVFSDEIFVNLYGVFKGFFKSPKPTAELAKNITTQLIDAVESIISKNDLVLSDFTETQRAEVITLAVKNIFDILSKMLLNPHQEIKPENSVSPPSGMKKHLSTQYSSHLMKKLTDHISKVLFDLKPLLPIDSVASCRCNIKRKGLGDLFKPFYMSAYAAAYLFPDFLNLIVVVRPIPLALAHTISFYIQLLLKASSAVNKISGCTRHYSWMYSDNQFFYLGISAVCWAIERIVEEIHFEFAKQPMGKIDQFLLEDALTSTSLILSIIASHAFNEQLPGKNPHPFDIFLLPRKATRILVKKIHELFFSGKIQSPEGSFKKIKNRLNSPYLQVSLEWLLQRHSVFPTKLYYLFKNPALKKTKEYKIDLLPIVLERESVKKLFTLYEEDIKKALSMAKIMKMLASFMKETIKSPATAVITTAFLWPLYFLQDNSFDTILKQLETAVEEHNKKFQVTTVEESDVAMQPLTKNMVIVSNHELEMKQDDEDYLVIDNDNSFEEKPSHSLQQPVYCEVPALVGYLANVIWQRITPRNIVAKKDWTTLKEEENTSTALELRNL